MENNTTKERIIKESLNLFSKKGYEAVTVAEIGKAVGIKAPSLYKHYKSKKDIFNAIINVMNKDFMEHIYEEKTKGFDNLTEEELLSRVKGFFLYVLHNEYECKFRRMLVIEQYHNKELAEMYRKRYIDSPVYYHISIFKDLIAKGILNDNDVKIMAFQYYSFLYMLLTMCDSQPEFEETALEMLEQQVKQFNKNYRVEE